MTIPADYFLNTRKADLWMSLRNIFAADLREFRRPIRVWVLDAAGEAFQLRQETLESVFEPMPDSAHLNQESLCLPLSIVFVDLDGRELSACLKLSQDAAVEKTKEPAMYRRPIGSELWHSSPACPHWPTSNYEEKAIPTIGRRCSSCWALQSAKDRRSAEREKLYKPK